MSADSPRRVSKSQAGTIVRPKSVSNSNKSVMGAITEIFQGAYSSVSSPPPDDRDKIQWMRLEQLDTSDCNGNQSAGSVAPLLLILGYANGIQIWIILASGDAHEVLSLRQGHVNHVRLLPRPLLPAGQSDELNNKRPIIAMSDGSSAGQPYCNIKLVSLKTGDDVGVIPYRQAVCDVLSNHRVMVVVFEGRFVVYDAWNIKEHKEKFWVIDCYPSPYKFTNPVALGSRWLAYAGKALIPIYQSGGSTNVNGVQSYASTFVSAAKSTYKNIVGIKESIATSVSGNKHSSTNKRGVGGATVQGAGLDVGVVTVIDTQDVEPNEHTGGSTRQFSVREDIEVTGLVAHFQAHTDQPIAALAFDPTGFLLLTADTDGRDFNLFKLMTHPISSSLSTVNHLYQLHRGGTFSQVMSVCFSHDSRWVSVYTQRGTTHVFPISTYGGELNLRTHTSRRVVNRASRYHRSAGLEDMDLVRPGRTGRDSPCHQGVTPSPSSSPARGAGDYHPPSALNMGNPRLAVYPPCHTVESLVRIHRAYGVPGIGTMEDLGIGSGGTGPGARGAKSATSGCGRDGAGTSGTPESVSLPMCFAPSRGWVGGSVTGNSEESRAVESLFVVNWEGFVTEYIITPRLKSTIDKPSPDAEIEADHTARVEWNLCRLVNSVELRAPLLSNNHLIMLCETSVNNSSTNPALPGRVCHVGRDNERSSSVGQRSRERSASGSSVESGTCDDDLWLSQVDMVTYMAPHRRLWMGPQFVFKTFQGSTIQPLSSGSSVLLSETTGSGVPSTNMDRVNEEFDLHSLRLTSQSSPMDIQRKMKGSSSGCKQRNSSSDTATVGSLPYTAVIEAMDSGSFSQSPASFMEEYFGGAPPPRGGQGGYSADLVGLTLDKSYGCTEDQLEQCLADAMTESTLQENSGTEPLRSTESRGLSFSARSSPPNVTEQLLVCPSKTDDQFN